MYFLGILKNTIKTEEHKASEIVDGYEKRQQIIDTRKSLEVLNNLEIIGSGLFEAYLFFTQSFLDVLFEIIPLYYKNGQGTRYTTIKSSILKHRDSETTELAKILKSDDFFDKLIIHRGEIYHHPAKGVLASRITRFGEDDKLPEEFLVQIPKLFINIFDEDTKIMEAVEEIEIKLNEYSTALIETILKEKT